MGRQRRWTDEQLIEAVKGCTSIFAVVRHLGLRIGGGTHYETKRHIARLGLDTTHFRGQAWNKGLRGLPRAGKQPLAEILVERSAYVGMTRLKKRLLDEGLLKNECYECHSPPEWRGRPLVMRMDHINGDRGDQRIENLRMLCPNCDSQTPTFAGRNKRRKSKPE
jgi:hypothetical protein